MMNRRRSLLDGYFVDLEVLDLDVFGHILGQHFDDGLAVGLEPDIGLVALDLLPPDQHVPAIGEVGLEVMRLAGNIM